MWEPSSLWHWLVRVLEALTILLFLGGAALFAGALLVIWSSLP